MVADPSKHQTPTPRLEDYVPRVVRSGSARSVYYISVEHVDCVLTSFIGLDRSGRSSLVARSCLGARALRRKAQLAASERREIGFGSASAKIDFEVVRREIWRSSARQKGGRLLRKIGCVLGTSGCCRDIHHVAVPLAPML